MKLRSGISRTLFSIRTLRSAAISVVVATRKGIVKSTETLSCSMTEPNIPLVLCISLSFLMCTIAAQLQQEQVYRYSARIEGLLDTVAMNRNITGSAIRPSASSKEYRERFVTWRSNALKEDFFFSNQTLVRHSRSTQNN